MESHAGSTYCALAALHLSARLGVTLSAAQQADATRWLLALQQPGSGFAGRVGKEADVCYSFWLAAGRAACRGRSGQDAGRDAGPAAFLPWPCGTQHARARARARRRRGAAGPGRAAYAAVAAAGTLGCGHELHAGDEAVVESVTGGDGM
ncbi:hypothetical protein FA09DRAFT_328843, partial [Tilletiopsis washingtonensis]